MPEVHVPKVEGHGSGHSVLRILLEVVLISTGVFLGLAGEQWRERARQRELADETLRRFRTEIQQNRRAVLDVKDYHVDRRKELEAYFTADPAKRKDVPVHFTQGFSPARLTHTAWDLALANQSLAFIDSGVGYSLSEIYRTQEQLIGMTAGLTQAMYITPPNEDLKRYLASVYVYYSDAILIEPQLVAMYDAIMPRIDSVLGRK